jgi:hypothetical protein
MTDQPLRPVSDLYRLLLNEDVQPSPPAPPMTRQQQAAAIRKAIDDIRNDASYPLQICPANGEKHLIHPADWQAGGGYCACGVYISVGE